MTDRTSLALAACQGLSDDELAQRGLSGFAKMINRKRTYATAARGLYAVCKKQEQEIAKLQAELAQAKATIAQLEALDAPIGDTAEADQLIAGIMKSAKGE